MTQTLESKDALEHYDEDFVEWVTDTIATPDWTDNDIAEFIEELIIQLGIQSCVSAEDNYYMCTDDSYKLEAEFSEEFYDQVYGIPENLAFAIDWQRYWDHLLSYDFNYIIFKDNAYFFHGG